jgi:hypothetical protein
MMKNPDKWLDDLKVSLEKEHGRPFTDEEVEKAGALLKTLADIAVDIALEDVRRQEKLKEFPKGFKMDKEGYSCSICNGPASDEKAWFDKYGLKCGDCQAAINSKAIPPSLGKDRDGWYSSHELDMYFNLNGKILRRWVKEGLLIARTVECSGKRPGWQLFLLKENKAMLPPKKLVASHWTKEIVNGREEYVSGPWYWFVDPKEHLKEYGISEYFKWEPEKKDGV